MSRFVFISDTHTLQKEMKHSIPEGDYLFHTGDFTNIGRPNEVEEFLTWFNSIEGFKKKIFIPGNHEKGFEKKGKWLTDALTFFTSEDRNIVYLEDSEYLIVDEEFSRPLKIYGFPWQPEFHNWAFNLPRNGHSMANKLSLIPVDTDILLSHGPPMRILDYIKDQRKHVGCYLMSERLKEITPLINAFGHIHDGYGRQFINGTHFVNSAICTEEYEPLNEPIVLEITEENNEFKII